MDPISTIHSAIKLIRIIIKISENVDENRKSALTLSEKCQNLSLPLQTLLNKQPQYLPANYGNYLTIVLQLLKEIEEFLKIFNKPTTGGLTAIIFWFGMLTKDHKSHANSFQDFHDRINQSVADLSFGVLVDMHQNIEDIQTGICQDLRDDLENISTNLRDFRTEVSSSPSSGELLRQYGDMLQNYQTQFHNLLDEWDETYVEITNLRSLVRDVLDQIKRQSRLSECSSNDKIEIRSALNGIHRVIDDLRHESCSYRQQALLIDSVNESLVREITTAKQSIRQTFFEEFTKLHETTIKFQRESSKISDEILSSLQRMEFTEREKVLREERLSQLRIYGNQISLDDSVNNLLGVGAFGEVRRGKYRRRNVAIKIITTKGDPLREREKKTIENEILLMHYSSFPSILQIYGYCEIDSSTVYLVLELCAGSLWSYLQDLDRNPTISLSLSIAWISDIFSALNYLHDRGIIHLDVKGENVLLSDRLHCKLTDFGLSKQQMELSLGKRSSNAHGTFLFMAPEVRIENKSNHRSDVYSAGVTAYQILKREYPPNGRTPKLILNYFKSLTFDPLKVLLISCVQEDHKKRVSSKEALESLSNIQESDQSFHDPRDYLTENAERQGVNSNSLSNNSFIDEGSDFCGGTNQDLKLELWIQSSILFDQASSGSVASFNELEKLIFESDPDVTCSGYYLSLVHSGLIPTSRRRDEPDIIKIGKWVTDELFSKIHDNITLNKYEQFVMATLYEEGIVVSKDNCIAFAWYLESAERGHALAQYKAAVCFEKGAGVDIDESTAFGYYAESAEQGIVIAQYHLGRCYDKGLGVKRDEAMAIEWYLRSAQGGHSTAQYQLGRCYAKGLGVERNEFKATEWWLQAAQLGHAGAQYALGHCFRCGFGTVTNESLAFELYVSSAKQGHPSPQYQAGLCYSNGVGVTKDVSKAFEWFMRSAEQGYADAQYKIGDCYGNGLGVTKNESIAFEWYMRAAKQGNAAAQNNVGDCYLVGMGVKQDETEAYEWYLKSAHQGNATALYNLGYCFENGVGVTRDLSQALERYSMAVKQGDATAQKKVNELSRR